MILSPNPRGKNSINSQFNQGTTDENNNVKVHTIKILLDSSASASIVRREVQHKLHKILNKIKNKLSTTVETFNSTLLTDLRLKLPETNLIA